MYYQNNIQTLRGHPFDTLMVYIRRKYDPENNDVDSIYWKDGFLFLSAHLRYNKEFTIFLINDKTYTKIMKSE